MMGKAIESLRVEAVPVSAVRPRSNNPRTHSDAQIAQIARSIETFGFNAPVLIDDANGIVAGHGRVEAAKRLGLEQVPCVRLSHLNPRQLRAYVIADNRLAEGAGWDRELLAAELGGLIELDIEFDLTVTGFEAPEIDLLLHDVEKNVSDGEDDAPMPTDARPIARPGDVWRLGRHRVLCADALEGSSLDALLGDDRATLVFADPPFNMNISGVVTSNRTHGEFAMASGEMKEEEFIAFLTAALRLARTSSVDGALVYVAIDWRHVFELLSAGREAELELKNVCVWAKNNGGMGGFYRSAHELFAVFKSGRGAHVNNIELGRHGRNRTNVWSYPGMNAFSASRREALAMHPTVKPVALVADVLLDASRRGDLVLDPFAGSGSTLIAAEKTGRSAALIEIEPKYVDVILERWRRFADDEPVRDADGRTFAEAHAAGGRP